MQTSAIVLVRETKNYRKLAQQHWGLTDEQMRGMHVHHYPEKCNGGRNIPEHLYVCSPSIHAHCWHDGDWFVEKAAKGGSLGKRKSTKPKKKPLTVNERKELNTRINKMRVGKKYTDGAKEKMSEAHKNSPKSQQNICSQNTKEWMDPEHPELGVRTVSALVRMQKKRNYPSSVEHRVKVSIE